MPRIKWSTSPSVDPPVFRLFKHTTLPMVDASSFQDHHNCRSVAFTKPLKQPDQPIELCLLLPSSVKLPQNGPDSDVKAYFLVPNLGN